MCKQYKQCIKESRMGSFSRELVALQTILRADDGDGKSIWPQLQSYNMFQAALVTVPKAMPLGECWLDVGCITCLYGLQLRTLAPPCFPSSHQKRHHAKIAALLQPDNQH